MDGEVTSKIDTKDLADLVETTTTRSHQRVTSPIPTATLERLLGAAPISAQLAIPTAIPAPSPSAPMGGPDLISTAPLARSPLAIPISLQPSPLPPLPLDGPHALVLPRSLPLATPLPMLVEPAAELATEPTPYELAAPPRLDPAAITTAPIEQRRRWSSPVIVAISCATTLVVGLVALSLLL